MTLIVEGLARFFYGIYVAFLLIAVVLGSLIAFTLYGIGRLFLATQEHNPLVDSLGERN